MTPFRFLKYDWKCLQVRRIAAELLNVLLYLSKLRPPVIHRDVKPENVILGGGKTGGKVYLVDFGGVQVHLMSAKQRQP